VVESGTGVSGELTRSCVSGQMNPSFTAQPEAPASTKAGASGWAVNSNSFGAIRFMQMISSFLESKLPIRSM
jgi:hypothetical protein